MSLIKTSFFPFYCWVIIFVGKYINLAPRMLFERQIIKQIVASFFPSYSRDSHCCGYFELMKMSWKLFDSSSAWVRSESGLGGIWSPCTANSFACESDRDRAYCPDVSLTDWDSSVSSAYNRKKAQLIYPRIFIELDKSQ